MPTGSFSFMRDAFTIDLIVLAFPSPRPLPMGEGERFVRFFVKRDTLVSIFRRQTQWFLQSKMLVNG
jgi:hypothetical protein